MKIVRQYAPVISIVCTLLLASCGSGKPAVSINADALRQAIVQNEWVFSMQSVTPSGGRTRFPAGNYEVTVRGDSLISQLPYFGRAYSGADVMSTQSVMIFSSKAALLEKKEETPGKWVVVFKPTDQRQVQSLYFILSENGNAQLNVSFTNRSAISYSGYVMPWRKD